MNLPSKKLFIVFIPLIVLLGIFTLVRGTNSLDEVKNSEIKPKVVSVQNAIINVVDTDMDEVPDWEEALWKTDPKNPKTFNSVPDKEYIASQIAKEKTDGVINIPIITTDELSKRIFAEYLEMKKSGAVDVDTINKMAARIADDVVLSPLNTPYSTSEITTFQDRETAKIQIYADTLMTLVDKYTTMYASQVDVRNISSSGEDFINFSETTSGFYLKLSQDIMKLSVPQGALSAHIDYANSLKESAQSMQELSQIKYDQMKSLTGIGRQSLGQADQEKAIENLRTFFNKNGIIGFNLPIL